MTQTHFSITFEIRAAPQLVWEVMTDVTRWPDWTASVSHVKLLTSGPLRIGSRVRIYQPNLPPASWRVTELNPGKHFIWVSVAPGVRVTARHVVEATANGCRATLSLDYEGLFGRWLARWIRNLNDRYLAMEANGLKENCERRAGP